MGVKIYICISFLQVQDEDAIQVLTIQKHPQQF